MDADGVDCQVLYPSLSGGSGEVIGAISDPALQLACVQAYNNWLIDVWKSSSPRFIPQCLVPIYSPQEAATEVARAVALGHRGVIMPGTPWDLQDVPHINDLRMGSLSGPFARTCKSPSASTRAQLPKCGFKPGRASPPFSPTP